MQAKQPILFALLAALATTPSAQNPGEPPAALESASRSVGTAVFDGELWGAGPDYKVHFGREAVTFEPALGRKAERSHSLAFSLESVRRGDAALGAAAVARSPEEAPDGIRYSRGAGVVERYELRAEGLYQSFVFDAPPAGSGDLVVRGRLATELPLGAVSYTHLTLPTIYSV